MLFYDEFLHVKLQSPFSVVKESLNDAHHLTPPN